MVLHRSIYKLMSAYNKDILQLYAEGAGIFTHSQEGFRPGRVAFNTGSSD